MEITEALEKLDHSNPEHWTGDGLPKINVVEELVGRSLKRSEITAAAPHFKRSEAPVEQPPRADAPEEVAPAASGILDLPLSKIAADQGLIDEALRALSEMNAELMAQRQAANVKSSWINGYVNTLERLRAKGARSRAHDQREQTLAYIQRQNEARQAKAARARAFLEGGTSIGEINRALAVASPLDQSLKNKPR